MTDHKKHLSKLTAAALMLATGLTFAIAPGLSVADDRGHGQDQQDHRKGGGKGGSQQGKGDRPSGPQFGPRDPGAHQGGPVQPAPAPTAKAPAPAPAAKRSILSPGYKVTAPAQPAKRSILSPGYQVTSPAKARDARRHQARPAPAGRYRGPVYGGHFHTLPRGHVVVRHRGNDFYYYNGYFHRHDPDGYVIVNAPLGAVVFSLPVGFRTVVAAGLTYFVLNDIWYRSAASGYEVVPAPPNPPVYDDATGDRGIIPGDKVRVAVNQLNVRTGPGFEYSVVEVIMYNSLIEVQSGTNGWLFIRLPDGKAGWIMERFVVLEAPGASG